MAKALANGSQAAGTQEDCEGGSRRRSWGLLVTAGVGGTLVALYAVATPFVTPALRKVCLPFVPATSAQIQNVLKMLENRSGSLVDIGSGDGRIVSYGRCILFLSPLKKVPNPVTMTAVVSSYLWTSCLWHPVFWVLWEGSKLRKVYIQCRWVINILLQCYQQLDKVQNYNLILLAGENCTAFLWKDAKYLCCDCERAVTPRRFVAATCEAVRLNSTVLLEDEINYKTKNPDITTVVFTPLCTAACPASKWMWQNWNNYQEIWWESIKPKWYCASRTLSEAVFVNCDDEDIVENGLGFFF